MTVLRTLIVSAIAALLYVTTCNAQTLTFDDLHYEDQYTNAVTNGYGELTWSNVYILDAIKENYSDTGYGAGTVSPRNVAYNGWASPAAISSTSPFTFRGAYFTSAWTDDNVLTIEGFAGGQRLYTMTTVLTDGAPQWAQAGFSDIDTLVLTSSNSHFAMDNFTYDGGPAAVPEPATALLLGGGLAAAVFSRRRSGRR